MPLYSIYHIWNGLLEIWQQYTTHYILLIAPVRLVNIAVGHNNMGSYLTSPISYCLRNSALTPQFKQTPNVYFLVIFVVSEYVCKRKVTTETSDMKSKHFNKSYITLHIL